MPELSSQAIASSSRIPATHQMSEKNSTTPSQLHSFRPPRLRLDLAIGHKSHSWHLVFARNYCVGSGGRWIPVSQEIVRLDKAGMPLTVATTPSGRSCYRFWIDEDAASGWELASEDLLEYIRQAGSILGVGAYDIVTARREVEVLLSEHRLSHCCEVCGRWEVTSDVQRWIMTSKDPAPALPRYMCPSVSGLYPLLPLLTTNCSLSAVLFKGLETSPADADLPQRVKTDPDVNAYMSLVFYGKCTTTLPSNIPYP